METTVNASELAAALASAASPSTDKVPALGAVHLAAVDGKLAVTRNTLDFSLTISLSAEVAAAGEVAVSAPRLQALAASFDFKASIEISASEAVATIGRGRSRFKLATVPLCELPTPPLLVQQIGSVQLPREDLVTLLRPAFVVGVDPRRYLEGILLHDGKNGLLAVGTDGRRLARWCVPGPTGLSADFTPIVPRAVLRIISRLLADKSNERLTLRRSATLFSIETARIVFVSKLIDGTFPDYSRAIPTPSGNCVTVDRVAMLQALDHVQAVAEKSRVVALSWNETEPALRLGLAGSDGADDVLEAEVIGVARSTAQIHLLHEMLSELSGQRARIDSAGGGNPILLLDVDHKDFTGILMPCAAAPVPPQPGAMTVAKIIS